MSKTDTHETVQIDAETGFAPDGTGPGGAIPPQDLSSLKQVREILVGPLTSEIDQTVRELDQRLDRSIAEFSEKTSKRVEEVETRIEGELKRFNEELGDQHEQHQDAIGLLERETTSEFDRLQQSIKDLSGDVTKATDSLRAELGQIRDQVEQLGVSVTERLEDESKRLRDELVDRPSLSAALSEVALRLAGPSGSLHDHVDDEAGGDIDLDGILDG